MTRSVKLGVAFGVLAAAATITVLVLSVLRATSVECEVCVRFGGSLACRSAAGASRDEAIRTASENACAFLASGMTDSVRCANTPPELATCNDD